MKNYSLGQQVIDIRDGKKHIIIDMEFINDIFLIYTDTTSIPSDYIINTENPLWYHLMCRKKTNNRVTSWLKENGTLKIKCDEFDFSSFVKECLGDK